MTLHTALGSAPAAADLDAARLGLSRADLLTSAPDHAPAPTFAEYIPGFRH